MDTPSAGAGRADSAHDDDGVSRIAVVREDGVVTGLLDYDATLRNLGALWTAPAWHLHPLTGQTWWGSHPLS